eukprot:scpid87930/ scgid10348/ 
MASGGIAINMEVALPRSSGQHDTLSDLYYDLLSPVSDPPHALHVGQSRAGKVPVQYGMATPKEDYIPLHALLEKRSSSDVQSTPLWHEPLSSSPTSSQHNVTSHTACSAPEFLGTNGTANDIQQCQPPVNARTQPAVSLPQHQWPQTTGSVTNGIGLGQQSSASATPVPHEHQRCYDHRQHSSSQAAFGQHRQPQVVHSNGYFTGPQHVMTHRLLTQHRRFNPNMSPLQQNHERTRHMKEWLLQHRMHPYPNKVEMSALAAKATMTMQQAATWFANQRRSIKKIGMFIYSDKRYPDEEFKCKNQSSSSSQE